MSELRSDRGKLLITIEEKIYPDMEILVEKVVED